MIDYNSSLFTDVDRCCTHCSGKIQENLKLLSTSSVLLIQLAIYNVENRVCIKRDFELLIHNINDEYLVNNSLFKIVSIIFHHGSSIESGHYTCIVKNNGSWYSINDNHVQRLSILPTLKDVYLIILEKSIDHCENVDLIENKNKKSDILQSYDKNCQKTATKRSINQIINECSNSIIKSKKTKSHEIILLPNLDKASC